MTVAERKEICKMLIRMERQKEFSLKLGLVNKSILKKNLKENKQRQ